MGNPRDRRLKVEYEELKEAFGDATYVTVTPVEGNPPHRYWVEYRVLGVAKIGGKIEIRDIHEVEIFLPKCYPSCKPMVKARTPIFHPNLYLSSGEFCLWDHRIDAYYGGSLVELVRRVGEMIMFQSYNLDSPANSEAASWTKTALEKGKLPIDNKNIMKKNILKI